jgi:glycosyltransferase involved in cell wall biosynthesis
MIKLALAMIVKGSDDEAECLKTCLSYVAEYVDGIFITRTHKVGEKLNKKVADVVNLYGGQLSDFEWVNDFAKARNFNFSQVPKEYDYILWLDADDALRGADKLRETIEQNPADTYSLHYMYGFDKDRNPITVHAKTQIVKNDSCVEWIGELHEDFRENRITEAYFIKGIERIHLSTESRFNQAKERNLEIALGQLDKNPNDPRSFWNVANSMVPMKMYDDALKNFDTFLELSNSDDEKYMVRLRRSEIFWQKGDLVKAIDEARFALGIKPMFPDAYFLLGSLYYESEKFWDAADMYIQGLVKKPPYYEIIAYNPRDYDYVPMMNLAKTYIALSRPDLALPLLEGAYKIVPSDKGMEKMIDIIKKEADSFEKVLVLIKDISSMTNKKKMKEALDAIPDDYKNHPAICRLRNINFIKTKTTGRDLVIFCGLTEDEWNGETARTQGLGGSEESVVNIAEGLVERGWNVSVYNNCGYREVVCKGVKYLPHWSWNYRDKQDIVILWRTPRMADFDINAPKIYLDLHDAIGVKTDFHRSLFPKVPDDKFVVIPNGIDPDSFYEVEKDPFLIINTSSPERSITGLIDIFKRIKKVIPQARCQWAYGWKVFDSVHSSSPAIMNWKQKVLEDIKESGIEMLGRISHEEVAKLYRKANIFLYPTEFAEIHCISAAKAQAGGAIPVTTDFAALNETVQFGFKFHSAKTKDTWALNNTFDFAVESEEAREALAEEAIRLIREPIKDRHRMTQWAKETYSWYNIINQWHDLFR